MLLNEFLERSHEEDNMIEFALASNTQHDLLILHLIDHSTGYQMELHNHHNWIREKF